LTADFVSKMYDLCSVIKISLQLAVNSLSTDFGHMNSCKMTLVCNEQCYCWAMWIRQFDWTYSFVCSVYNW